MDEVDQELLKTFEKLGISLEEQKRLVGMESKIAVDAVIDSVSVKTTFKEVLAEKGIIFVPFQKLCRNILSLLKIYGICCSLY